MMISKQHPKESLLELFHRKGVVRLNEIKKLGIHLEYVRRLCKSGEIVRSSRGMYSASDFDITEHHSLAEVCKRVPQGVICLLSALSFHGLTTQMPREISVAIGIKTRKPKATYPPIRVFRFSETCLEKGTQEHLVEGVTIRVSNPAKTIADCFKYRNKVGLDVAIEALHDVIRQKKATFDEIIQYAKICRVENIIKPYLETIAWQQSEN